MLGPSAGTRCCFPSALDAWPSSSRTVLLLSRVGPNIFQVVWGMALASLLGGTVGTSWLPPWRRGIDTG
jgi:hypothetical protein